MKRYSEFLSLNALILNLNPKQSKQFKNAFPVLKIDNLTFKTNRRGLETWKIRETRKIRRRLKLRFTNY